MFVKDFPCFFCWFSVYRFSFWLIRRNGNIYHWYRIHQSVRKRENHLWNSSIQNKLIHKQSLPQYNIQKGKSLNSECEWGKKQLFDCGKFQCCCSIMMAWWCKAPKFPPFNAISFVTPCWETRRVEKCCMCLLWTSIYQGNYHFLSLHFYGKHFFTLQQQQHHSTICMLRLGK